MTTRRELATLGLGVLLVLGCGAPEGLTRTTRTLRAFTIVSGVLDVSWPLLGQAIVWAPLDRPEPEMLESLWNATSDMLEAAGVPSDRPPAMPALQDVPAGDKPGRGWTWTAAGGTWSAVTAVPCTSSGVRVYVHTSGVPESAQALHAASLASIVCAGAVPGGGVTTPGAPAR